MAYDEQLAERVRVVLEKKHNIDEKKMFGGIAWMQNGKMFCGIVKDALMLRLGPEGAEAALQKKHVRPMDFTGKPMKGYVYVAAEGIKTKQQLANWIEKSIEFVKALPAKKK